LQLSEVHKKLPYTLSSLIQRQWKNKIETNTLQGGVSVSGPLVTKVFSIMVHDLAHISILSMIHIKLVIQHCMIIACFIFVGYIIEQICVMF